MHDTSYHIGWGHRHIGASRYRQYNTTHQIIILWSTALRSTNPQAATLAQATKCTKYVDALHRETYRSVWVNWFCGSPREEVIIRGRNITSVIHSPMCFRHFGFYFASGSPALDFAMVEIFANFVCRYWKKCSPIYLRYFSLRDVHGLYSTSCVRP